MSRNRFSGDIFLEVDCSKYTPRPMEPAEIEKYLEMLRKHRPAEYARIMKERELRKKPKDGQAGSSTPTE
jgi:hypothetical protein